MFSDVNGDYPAWNSRPHVYAHLAHQLSARGHAVYRFAKRGPGTGSVEVDAAAAAKLKNFAGRIVIARAALAAMRAALAERSLKPRVTILAGHSEGAVVVSLLVQSEPAVRGVVLLSGPSVGLLEIMREQMAETLPPNDPQRDAYERAVRYIRRGEPIPDELLRAQSVTMLTSMGPAALAYLREVDAIDPAAEAGRIAQPVLIVQGGRDGSVRPHHAKQLRAARESRPTELLFFPELQHMYKPLPDGVTGFEAFGLEGETDRRVADGMNEWIRRL